MKEVEKFIRESANSILCCELIINDNLYPQYNIQLKRLLKILKLEKMYEEYVEEVGEQEAISYNKFITECYR